MLLPSDIGGATGSSSEIAVSKSTKCRVPGHPEGHFGAEGLGRRSDVRGCGRVRGLGAGRTQESAQPGEALACGGGIDRLLQAAPS
jgi:hypothetical protein